MKVPLHIVKARRARLAQLVRERQYLPVGEVCSLFRISEATARRDLSALAEERAITRTRGGAITEYNQRFPSFRERLQRNPAGKRRIAQAAHALLRPGSVVWLDSGTTCHGLAQALLERPVENLTVVTNNMPAAELLGDSDAIAVHLSGGQYFRRSSLLVAGNALENLRSWRFDMAFLGAEGLTTEGLWNSIDDVVAVQLAIAAAAGRSIFCIDATKVGHRADAFLLAASEIEALLTDADAPTLRAHGIRLPARRLIAA